MKLNRQLLERMAQEHGRFFADRRVGCLQFKVCTPRTVDRIVTTFHAACEFVVPIGYQDKTGFHYGEMPQPEQELPESMLA